MSRLYFLNPNDRRTKQQTRYLGKQPTFILWVGQAYYSEPTYFFYYGRLADALDAVIDWLADPKNGHTWVLCNEQVEEEYRAYIEDHKHEYKDGEQDADLQSKARTQSEADTISGGNCGDYIMSDSVGIKFENPTRQQVKDLIADLQARNYDNSSVVVIV